MRNALPASPRQSLCLRTTFIRKVLLHLAESLNCVVLFINNQKDVPITFRFLSDTKPMARETFITKKFGKAAINMIAHAVVICDNYAEQGYDLSLRQLYYQFVSKNLIPNTEKDYKNLGNLISDARLAGLLDWDMIRDRGRTTIENPHWSSPADISGQRSQIASVWTCGRARTTTSRSWWRSKPLKACYCQSATELDVPFTSNKGYSSSSALCTRPASALRRSLR
jgi:hypothetical protein